MLDKVTPALIANMLRAPSPREPCCLNRLASTSLGGLQLSLGFSACRCDQVLLSYPLRRPLQAAALWLAARANLAEGCGEGGWMVGGCGGRRSECIGVDGGGAHLGVVLSDEHGQLLVGIRKVRRGRRA